MNGDIREGDSYHILKSREYIGYAVWRIDDDGTLVAVGGPFDSRDAAREWTFKARGPKSPPITPKDNA